MASKTVSRRRDVELASILDSPEITQFIEQSGERTLDRPTRIYSPVAARCSPRQEHLQHLDLEPDRCSSPGT